MQTSRKHGQVLEFTRKFLSSRGGRATISEVQAALNQELGDVPSSSVRSCLQNTRYFERTGRGEYRLLAD